MMVSPVGRPKQNTPRPAGIVALFSIRGLEGRQCRVANGVLVVLRNVYPSIQAICLCKK